MKSKESIGRRTFLLRGAVPVAGMTVLGMTRPEVASAAESRRDYKPSYFNAEEWAFVNAAVDRLIPADESGPGGAGAGVPEFIDRQLEMPYGHGAYTYMLGPFMSDLDPTLGYQLPYTPRDLCRGGIASANKACRAKHGASFEKLSSAQQDAFLGLALRALGCPEACNAWVGQVLRFGQSFFANTIGVPKLLSHQEPVGRNAQTGVVVKPPPASALVVAEPKFLLEILAIALDSPAHLGLKDHALQRHVLAQRS